MVRRTRIIYTDSQKALMWDRWKKGESLQQIAQLFDRHHSSVQRILAESGGIRPPPRIRSRTALTLIEREEISRSIVAGDSMRTIARSLARSLSTIRREITRNGGVETYRAAEADAATCRSRHHTQNTDNHGKIIDAISIGEPDCDISGTPYALCDVIKNHSRRYADCD